MLRARNITSERGRTREETRRRIRGRIWKNDRRKSENYVSANITRRMEKSREKREEERKKREERRREKEEKRKKAKEKVLLPA